MKRLLVLVPLLFTGCPQAKAPLCEIQKKASDSFASSIAVAFNCAKTDAIASSLNKALEPVKLCEGEVAPSSVITDFVCPAMVKYAVGQGVNALPSEWECTGGTATTELLEAKLNELCGKLPL